MTIKKWSGSAWVDQYVTTNVSNIVASGTPSSTTFLRGDGQWATPIDTNTNNYVSSATFDGSTLTLNRQGLTALTVDLSSLAGGGGSGYGLKLSGTITGNQTLESLFESSYDTNGIPDVIGSYWVVTAATANVTFITTAQQHGSGPSIHYCLIADYLEENDATGQFTLEKHDWLMITSYTGSGTGGNPYVVKFSVINNTYTGATATQYGIVKYVSNTAQTQAANSLSAVSGRTYAVQKDSNGDMVVNVPWVDTNTDTNTTYTAGSGLVLTGTEFKVNLISDTAQTVAANTASATASRTYPIQFDSDGDLVVNVPWVDTNTNTTYTAGTGLSLTGTVFANTAPDQTVALTGAGNVSISGTYPNFTITGTDANTTYGIATSTTAGLVEVFSDTDQSVAANAVSATAGRTYGIQLNSANQMVVNVPWVDTNTNTTYTAGTGLSLTGTVFANTAPDQTVSLTGGGATTISGTYPNFTISSTDTNTDTNNYLTGVSGSGNGTVTFTRTGLSNLTWNASHTHDYVPERSRTDWNDSTVIDDVIGQLAWKNYGNNHTIFDASASTSPAGGSISNTNPQVNWSATYPTLMGWNGSNTYGVRVDVARYADSAGSAGSISGQANSATITASTGVNGNHIVQRDANGYIYANHINFNTTESENPTINSFITSNGDGWSRKSTLAHVKNSIRGVADGTWSINITGSSGSTGNADTVDGQHASAFAAASHTHSNYLPIAGAPYYSPVANSMLIYNTTYGWLTTAKHYDWNLIRNHTGTVVLDDTGALGTVGGSTALTVSVSAGDVLMMEISPYNSVIAGYTTSVVMVRLGAADTTPTNTQQTVLMMTERLNSTTFYEYVVKVSASGSTLYFDDSFRRSYVDTSTASNIIVEASNGCFIGKIWRLEI